MTGNNYTSRRRLVLSGIRKKAKQFLLKTFWRFDSHQLSNQLHKMGVKSGDVLMVHGAWRPDSGFTENINALVQSFIDTVGPEGTVCMMSMPFHGKTAAKYLALGKKFDIRKTISMVGLLSESFRRKKGVIRSLHPTHSMTATGRRAEWLVSGHELCLSPFDPDSPFDRLVESQAKILMYDVPFNTMTFEHYIEDRIEGRLPFQLYEKKIYECECIDIKGNNRTVKTKALSKIGNEYRDSEKLKEILIRHNALIEKRYKNINLIVVEAKKAMAHLPDIIELYRNL